MNHFEKQNRGDGKLLAIVAGCVVAGAAAIALLAGLASSGEVEQAAPAVAQSPRRAAPVAEVVPAVRVTEAPAPMVETASIVEIAEPETSAATVEPATVEIDPGADFIAEGTSAWHKSEFERAAAYFGAEVAQRPERSWTQYMLGLSLWKSGDAAAAEPAMQRALELNPSSVKAAVNLARIRNDLGSFESALAAADAAVVADGSAAQAQFLRARSLYNLGRIDEAVEAVEASLALDDTNGHAHNLLGLIRLEADDETRALGSLELAAELSPEAPYVHNNLGMALERSGRMAEAVVAYRAAVELDTEHPRATLNLARVEPLAPAREDSTGESDALLAEDGTEPPIVDVEETVADDSTGSTDDADSAGGAGSTVE
jgi:Flp pilus assembly protein TadD